MQRFKTITVICLTAVFLLVAGNVWYLYGLYDTIKTQAIRTVTECVRRADILEIITRINGSSSFGSDDSFIRLTLIVEGEKTPEGGYDYPNILGRLGQTMSGYFHIIEKSDTLIDDRNYVILDSIFNKELNNAGLYPREAVICPFTEKAAERKNMWSVDFSLSEGQEPVYTAYFSALNGYVLRQMSGIIVTSAAILVLTGFLIWYLLHSVGKLRTIEQMKDDFTHNMTHELKTPVAVAYSAADSMLRYYDQSDEARNRQFLKIIMQRLSFLSGMIENILSMSMERFKTMKLNIEPVELRPLVTEIAGMSELKATKPITITTDITDSLTVMADPLHLGNVISNLIDNAVKYSGDSVAIVITADSGKISVSDNGIGIEKENIPYIFDKFYRVTSGDRYEVGGYGLGLFYVRQITELLGWTVDVSSRPGEGSVFTIKFRNDEKK